MSDEGKARLSKLNKGKPSPLKGRSGKKHSEETKQKLREINLGKKYGKRDPSVGAKISKAMTGRTRSPEHCKNLSIAHLGQVPWNKGLTGLALPKSECPHCGRMLDPGNFKQYHGDKCKMKR